jgi:hypothetical protein
LSKRRDYLRRGTEEADGELLLKLADQAIAEGARIFKRRTIVARVADSCCSKS